MKHDPLTEDELNFLDHQLVTHGNENSLVDVSGLDGFLTAIVSGPDVVLPSTWMQAIWGGESPDWPDEETAVRYFELTFQHMNSITGALMNTPLAYKPLVRESERGEGRFAAGGSWAQGYMRGVAIADWPQLPESAQSALDAIALHAEENFDRAEQRRLAEHQESIESLGAAAIVLHQYWLKQRSPEAGAVRREPVRNSAPKVGRNEPCPCGSGKKFKQCCLQ